MAPPTAPLSPSPAGDTLAMLSRISGGMGGTAPSPLTPALVLVTPEGRDGLLGALAAAMRAGDPGLTAALRSVLAQTGSL
ncbi:hypothetical protein HaLaN_31201 [Haematococcus lacustris]|uniref:Uncharacterized protein n=1 Tax=Haematococcus lacustris TaxID=44745 RepID=A0A6A0AGH8_HAELA|nr:hypothetical protein HaLaN_31201 [Haematococcus lacustris]